MDYLHQGVKHSRTTAKPCLHLQSGMLLCPSHSCDTAVVVFIQVVGNPASALPQSKSGCPHGYSRHLCFGCFVAVDNLTSPDFTWWKKILQQLKHRKPGVTKNPESSQEGWADWGLGCKDNPTRKRNVCWSRAQRSELLLSLGTPSVQDYRITNIFAQAIGSDAPHQTSGGGSHEPKCKTCCNRNHVSLSPSGEVPQAPHGGGRDPLLLQPCSVWSKTSTSQI